MILVKVCLELVVQPADQLLRGLLVSGETALQGGHALVQEGAQVMNAAAKLLMQGVKLRLDVAHGLGLFHSRAVLLAQLELHVLDEIGKPGLKVGGADRPAAQVADIAAHGCLHGIHVHAQKFEGLAQVKSEALFSLKGRVKQVGGADY